MAQLAKRYHTTHIPCGHQAWYEDARLALRLSNAPCPWCGAETGLVAPYGVISYTGYGRVYPAPDMGVPEAREGDTIVVVHRVDEACCAGNLLAPS